MADVSVNGRRYRTPERPTVVICFDGCDPQYIRRGIADGCGQGWGDRAGECERGRGERQRDQAEDTWRHTPSSDVLQGWTDETELRRT